MAEQKASAERSVLLLFALGATVLAYIGGAYTARFQSFPYPQILADPFDALAAMEEQETAVQRGSVLGTGLWHRHDRETTGVVRHDAAKAFAGYTVYTSGSNTGAYLVDMDGKVVHEWAAPFSKVWPDAPQVRKPVPPEFIYWRRVKVFPNGDVIASYSGEADTPYGYGLAKFDRQSNLIWKYSANVHHDFEVQPDGSVWLLTQRIVDPAKEPVRGVPQLTERFVSDYVVHLSADGVEQKKISITEAIVNSQFLEMLQMYPRYINPPAETLWDPFHTNTVKVVTEEFARHHASIEAGQILLSIRNNDAIAVLDPVVERLTWVRRGFWVRQHDPDMLPNGNIMLFDNNGHGGPEGLSRVLEVNPDTTAIEWSYAGTKENPLFSIGRASQQLLPNDNVLITESSGGRILEVTRAREVVWEFHNPAIRREESGIYSAITCSAVRYSADEVPFLKSAAR